MIINGKRFKDFQTYKVVGCNGYKLSLTIREKLLKVNIPLEHGGQLASTWVRGNSYPVSFNKLPDSIKEEVVAAVEYIVENGNPVENDEHIYGSQDGRV